MAKIIALVGMPGSGKTTISKLMEKMGYSRIRFGDITDIEIKKRGMQQTPENEQMIAKEFRKTYGMDAYAKLNINRMDKALKEKDVVIDGLKSYEEFIYIKNIYSKKLVTVLVECTDKNRHKRLENRVIRPLKAEESKMRDKSETENTNTIKTIESADYKIDNNKDMAALANNLQKLLSSIKS